MSGAPTLPPRGGTVLPRAPRRLRSRLLVILALAAAGAVILLIRTLEPAPAHDRSAEIQRPAVVPAAERAGAAASAEATGAALRISVLDAENLPLEGVRCEVEPWGAEARTDDRGFALVPLRTGSRAEITVRASKEGYRPASRHGRFLEERTMKLKLLRAPEVRVLDQDGEPVAGVTWEGADADLRERKLRAKGYLDLDLADVPRALLSAWDDLLARAPVDIPLVSDEGIGRATLRAEHPAGATCRVAVGKTLANLPDLAPRLLTLPHDWRSYYAKRWMRDWRIGLDRSVVSGEEFRVYAEGTIFLTCLATDCRPLQREIEIPPGKTVEQTLVLEPETWTEQEIVVTDRFGREGSVSVELVRPVRLPLPSQGSAVRVPRGGGPYAIRADGGARGRAVQRVDTLPSNAPIRFELAGVEVHLKLLDDESGEPIEGLPLGIDGVGQFEWRPAEGAYVLGPVDPGTVRVIHDADRTADLHVDPNEAEKGVLRKELRVRGFPRGGSSEPE